MNFLNRLKFYLIGFSLGLFLIYTLFKDRDWDWLPENKVKKFILENPLEIRLEKNEKNILNDQFSKKIFDLIIKGNVNFSKSQTKSINKKYIIEYNKSSASIYVSFKDTVCRIISIDNMIFKDNYQSKCLDTIVFIDRSNLYLRFDKMEKKFTKNFLSKIEKHGLNSDDISKNLNNFLVNWKKSNPFSKLNSKYLGTININNHNYEISLETGNKKLRFKDFSKN
jgi:hypothetical protein